MSEAGPSRGSGGSHGNHGSSSVQRHKTYKHRERGGPPFRGGRGRGRGGPGRGGRGGHSNGEGGRAPGPSWEGEGEERKHHLGRYRDDPLSEIMMMPGITATAIQHKERSAERELIEVLERIADELYPETGYDMIKDEPEDDDMDFETMLNRELADVTGDRKSRRFRLCRHETPCVIYVNVLPPLDPARLARHLMEEIERSAKCPFRFVRRVIPIQGISQATLHALTDMSVPVLKDGFMTPTGSALTFGIIPNNRNSARLDRMDMIKAVADKVAELNPEHKADLKKPDRTILIEVNKNRLGMAVVSEYERFRKYNAFQLAEILATQAVAPQDAEFEAAASSDDPQGPTAAVIHSSPTSAERKQAHRDRKAEEMAVPYAVGNKRKLHSTAEVEEGEVTTETLAAGASKTRKMDVE